MEVGCLQQVQIYHPRRTKMFMGALGSNVIHKSSPWAATWWSVAMPGFGHIHLGMYVKGFILMGGEIAFNLLGHINVAIYYSLLGQFHRANQVLGYQWATLYCAIFAFSVYDSYRVAVEINKMAWLEAKQKTRDFTRNAIQEMDINALDKRIPWLGAFWSTVFTGLGHIYSHRIVSGFLLLGWTVAIAYYSKLPYLVMYSFTGQFPLVHQIKIDYEWVLFFPSIYTFGIFDAYEQVVTFNQLFKDEQIYYLQNKYGKNPIPFK